MICQQCGYKIIERSAVYCPECGEKIERKKNCLNCCWTNDIKNKFCIYCGSSFKEEELKITRIFFCRD